MSDRINRIIATIDNHIYVWSSVPSFAPMAEILLKNRDMLVEKLLDLAAGGVPKGGSGHDAVRLFLMDFALERMAGHIGAEHFTIFRDQETVEAILEDSYGTQSLGNRDDLLIPHQNEALKILTQCLFHGARAADEKELLCFLHLFSLAKPKACPDLETTMRLKSMIWFIYLAIEIVKTEPSVCSKGLEYFSYKFGQLLGLTIGGTIVNEESWLSGFEEGKWEKTLFGRLQGEGRKEFAQKLKSRFNMESDREHVGGRLLADHRNAMLEQTMVMFCK